MPISAKNSLIINPSVYKFVSDRNWNSFTKGVEELSEYAEKKLLKTDKLEIGCTDTSIPALQLKFYNAKGLVTTENISPNEYFSRWAVEKKNPIVSFIDKFTK